MKKENIIINGVEYTPVLKKIKPKKIKTCKHKWTSPSTREDKYGAYGAYDFWDVTYTICEKCAEEKIIRKDYAGKNYV